ncbi:MAG: homoserine dehydrogenase [Candidatus Hermodarchaeota archaeon]
MNVNICLIGKGIVGTSLIQLIFEKKDILKRKFNLNYVVNSIIENDGALIKSSGIDLKEVVESKQNFRNLPYWENNINFLHAISELDIAICIETTPTNPKTGEPGLSHIIQALNNHIDVVSSNKGPFYLEYEKLMNLAKQNKCYIKFEATVASCVPTLRIKEVLVGNEILSIKAILNGTSNFILSRMTAEGIKFSLALKEAQELGYAEADPSLDIEGYDAAGKLVILANELLGWSKHINDVRVEGISKVTSHAIELADTDGFVIKHLAIAENDKLIVEPRLIDKHSSLNISGNLNAVELETKYAGPILLMGRGAGGFEAASAILNDLIDISIKRGYNI